jgi:hypothetical protein
MATSFASICSYPRSTCSMPLITEVPSAMSAARMSVAPARRSAIPTSAPRSVHGPVIRARRSSSTSISAPIFTSSRVWSSRSSKIVSWIDETPSACVMRTESGAW